MLRRVRRRRGLTLHAVAEMSHGFMRPSTVAGYEHGARAISLERFVELCELYGVPPDRVLREMLGAAGSTGSVVDLTELERASSVPGTLPGSEE